MVGGYFSFQGIDGRARWRRTAVEDVLPVNCLPYDDRVETPEGIIAEILKPDHPIVAGLPGPWPALLGVNEVVAKSGPTSRSSPACRTTRVAIRCLSPGRTEAAARSPGLPTSGRIGCRPPLSNGRATRGSGVRRWAG